MFAVMLNLSFSAYNRDGSFVTWIRIDPKRK